MSHIRSMKLDEYLTVEDVATRLKVSTSWVYKHASLLGATKLGDRILRFPEAKVAEYLTARVHHGQRPARHPFRHAAERRTQPAGQQWRVS
jgi:excisionase family DNA binding protein